MDIEALREEYTSLRVAKEQEIVQRSNQSSDFALYERNNLKYELEQYDEKNKLAPFLARARELGIVPTIEELTGDQIKPIRILNEDEILEKQLGFLKGLPLRGDWSPDIFTKTLSREHLWQIGLISPLLKNGTWSPDLWIPITRNNYDYHTKISISRVMINFTPKELFFVKGVKQTYNGFLPGESEIREKLIRRVVKEGLDHPFIQKVNHVRYGHPNILIKSLNA